MSACEVMPGADGSEVRVYRRAARNAQPGDWLPEHCAHVLTEPVTDPDDGSVWLALDNGTDARFTRRGKVWLHRTYAAPGWVAEAVEGYRAARDARAAVRESSAPAPCTVAGTAGSAVAWCQLEDSDFAEACPAPRLADFLRDAAAARRQSDSMNAEVAA